MKIVRADKGKGKTTELIKKSNKEWKYIVTTCRKRACNIADMAREMRLDIPFPIAIVELPLKSGQRIDSVLVDDMEEILQYLIGKRIDYATTSCDVIGLDELKIGSS